MELPGSLERLHELVRNAAFPSFFAPVVPFERESVRIHGFELGSVPGLLQTEAYARALIRATRPHDRDADVERLVMARLERQEIMTKDNPPLLWYVLDESVLHRIVGSRAVMAEQIDQLITAASGPSTVVQVLTFAEGEGVGADGPFSIYEFREAPSVCYTETSSLSRGPRCTYGIGARTAPRRPGLPGPRGTQGNDAVDPG
jgi:hypothetical protein